MDVFDVELNFTYAHNSSLDKIGIYFPDRTTISLGDLADINSIPQDSSVAHQWQDVFGIRLGGEYVVVPSQLAVRVGGYVQSSGVDAQYLGLDFSPSQQFGLYAGGTYRVSGFDLSLGLGHVFFKTLDNGGQGAVYGIVADQNVDPATCSKAGLSPSPTQYRMCGPQNGGSLTQSLNVVSIGATKHF
jgi:long-chain fatty acid transport protein